MLFYITQGCAFAPNHRCQDAGDPARETPFRGDRECFQKTLPDGRVVNDGVYREYFLSGKLSLEGHYEEGHKSGVWTEWNEDGKVVVRKYFKDGIEAPMPASEN